MKKNCNCMHKVQAEAKARAKKGSKGKPKSNNKKGLSGPILILVFENPDLNFGRYKVLTMKEVQDLYVATLRDNTLKLLGYNYYQLNPDIEKTDMVAFRNSAKIAYSAIGDYTYDTVTDQAYPIAAENTP